MVIDWIGKGLFCILIWVTVICVKFIELQKKKKKEIHAYSCTKQHWLSDHKCHGQRTKDCGRL